VNEAIDRLRLARAEGVGPVTWQRLIRRFGSATEAVRAWPEMARSAGRPVPAIPSPDAAGREIAALAELGGRFLFAGDPDYPPLLALADPPPPALAVLGDPAALAGRAVALVGARNASLNGQRIAEQMAEALAAEGLIVVSGLARGVDTAAHEGALRAGRTVAVVASGLDMPYPPQNAALQARIAEQGAVVSEAPLGAAPQDRHFPRRNRIIAGLSLGVVVVEAAPRSGTLITARMALDLGRELFAVPGSPLDPRCRGSNALIREGAHLVQTAAEVLEDLPEAPREAPLFAPRMTVEKPARSAPESHPPDNIGSQIIEIIGASPVAVDDLVRRCHLSPAAVAAALLDLELAGRIETLPGNRVALIAP